MRFLGYAIAITAMVVVSPAHAWEQTQSQHQTARARAASSAHSTAAGGNASSAGSVSNTIDSRSANAPALGGLASGSCAGVSGGVSLGFLPFGGGANVGTIDHQCTLRNNISVVAQFQPHVAMEMLHGLEGYDDALARLRGTAPDRDHPAIVVPAPQLPRDRP